jgi:hypothetical protein
MDTPSAEAVGTGPLAQALKAAAPESGLGLDDLTV